MKYTPHKYQEEAIRFMVSRGAAGLFLDPGLGKTSITFAAFKILKTKGIVSTMLVIAPLRPAHSVWPRESEKWDAFSSLKVVVLHGPDKDRLLQQKADVYVINPEGLPWLFERRSARNFDMLVVDESTRFKHPNTQRFKILRPQLPFFKRRYILTGSPAPNGLMDLFGQVFILDLGKTLGRYITHYRMQFFNATGFGGYTYVPRAGAKEAIQAKLGPYVLRMDAKDLLELPELTYNKVEVSLPLEIMRQYRTMEEEMILQVEGGEVVAANMAVATQKCRQIANGGIYSQVTGEDRKSVFIHDLKTDATEELVEEMGGRPVLVAYEFDHDLARLKKRFGSDTPHIGGGVTPSRFKEIEAAWNAGKIPVLLAQPQSVAHGLNLQGTGAGIVWHSLTWNLEDYEQFIRRVWRQGQKERVIVHHIVTKNTVDEAIMASIGRKDRTQKSLLKALKEYVKGRSR